MSDQYRRVVVVGQGYVGLPLAIAAAASGFSVVGVDFNLGLIDVLNSGTSPIGDVTDHEVRTVLSSGAYRASASFEDVNDAEVVVVCVPTPYKNQAPDLSYVEQATRAVGAHLSQGSLVILESTTYPGTTEEVVLPILEDASGMKAGLDFELAFSPERIDPGNPMYGLHNTPKIVGGITASASARAAEFYGHFVERIVPVSSPATAEMAKLLENIFRHINIALVNELAMLCRDMNIDIWEVIDAAASKPFGFMPFYPGPGVGGHCIPVDPMYLSWRVRQFGGSAKFIDLARDINDAMPFYCVSRIQDLLNERNLPLQGAHVLVVGVAYKPNIADVRESPALPLVVALLKKGAIVQYHDPFVESLQFPDGERRSSLDMDESVAFAPACTVIVTPHDGLDYERLVEASKLVFDVRNALKSSKTHVVRL